MIWMALMRAGTLISLAAAVAHYIDLRTREVKPTRIYSSDEAARFLGLERHDVVQLFKKKQLRGRMVDGNLRIPGQSIIEYLSQ